jgi:septal ring factor EnvC (AmiA/AmiB activator)
MQGNPLDGRGGAQDGQSSKSRRVLVMKRRPKGASDGETNGSAVSISSTSLKNVCSGKTIASLSAQTRVRVRAPAVEVKLKVPELAVATASSAHLDADPSAHLASHLDELRMELSSQRAQLHAVETREATSSAQIESMRAQLHAVETREATSSAQIKELRKELGSRNRIMKYVMRRSAASESHADESELAHMYVGSGAAPSKS